MLVRHAIEARAMRRAWLCQATLGRNTEALWRAGDFHRGSDQPNGRVAFLSHASLVSTTLGVRPSGRGNTKSCHGREDP